MILLGLLQQHLVESCFPIHNITGSTDHDEQREQKIQDRNVIPKAELSEQPLEKTDENDVYRELCPREKLKKSDDAGLTRA